MSFKSGDRVICLRVVNYNKERNPRAVIKRNNGHTIILDFDGGDGFDFCERLVESNHLVLEDVYDSPLYQILSEK